MLDNDNGDGLTISCLDTADTLGEVTSNGDGTFDYTPPPSQSSAGDPEYDYFTYAIEDASGNKEHATVEIELTEFAYNLFIPVAQLCKPLYADDFSSVYSGWPEFSSDFTLYEYRGGEYRVMTKTEFGIAGANPLVLMSDYLMSVDVRNHANKSGTYGLLFSQVPDWSGFYTFEISSKDQTWAIWRWDGDWDLLDSGTSSSIQTGTKSNNLAIERNGGSIQAWINNTHVAGLNNSTRILRHPIKEGKMEIRESSFFAKNGAIQTGFSGMVHKPVDRLTTE